MRGLFAVTCAFLPVVLKSTSREKTIVNMSSMGAHLMGPGVSLSIFCLYACVWRRVKMVLWIE